MRQRGDGNLPCTCEKPMTAPGADVAPASRVPVQMWQGVSAVPMVMWEGVSAVPLVMWEGRVGSYLSSTDAGHRARAGIRPSRGKSGAARPRLAHPGAHGELLLLLLLDCCCSLLLSIVCVVLSCVAIIDILIVTVHHHRHHHRVVIILNRIVSMAITGLS